MRNEYVLKVNSAEGWHALEHSTGYGPLVENAAKFLWKCADMGNTVEIRIRKLHA